MARTKIRTENHVLVDSNLNLQNQHRIVNLADPQQATDAATKQYVDSIATGFQIKNPVKVAVNYNYDIENAEVDEIQNVVLNNGDRILFMGQTNSAENGVYVKVMDDEPAERATDFDDWSEIENAYVFVTHGSLAGTGWICNVGEEGTVGNDPILFQQFSSAVSYNAGNGISITGNLIAVKRNSSSALIFDPNGAVKVETDGSTIETSNNALRIKAGGIQTAHLNNYAVTSNKIAAGNILGSHIAYGVITKDKLGADVAGNGLIGGNGSSIDVGAGTGIIVGSSTVSVDSSVVLLFSKIVKQEFVVSPEPQQYVTLNYLPVNTNFMFVFYNGLMLSEGTSNDYTLSYNTITFNFTVKTGDKIQIIFVKN